MRVGILIDRWEPGRGGAELALAQLASHLGAAGHELHIFGARCEAAPPGTFHKVRAGGLTRGARERRLGRSMVAAARGVGCQVTVGVRHLEQVDLLWLHGGCHHATMAARRRAARGHVTGPVVLRGRHRAFDQLERTALEGGARRVVCPSELVAAELRERYPGAAARLEVIEPGIDLERFHPRVRADERANLRALLGLAPDTPLIVLPARNARLKGLPQLLAALDLLDDAPHLLVAGPRRRPRGVRRRPRVHWRPQVDALTLAGGADLCALPTWRDTFGLALIEALACGTPVVTSRFAGAAGYVRGAAGAVLDDPSDAPALARALEQVASARADPAQVRAVTAGLDLGRSLAGLTTLLEHLAAERRL